MGKVRDLPVGASAYVDPSKAVLFGSDLVVPVINLDADLVGQSSTNAVHLYHDKKQSHSCTTFSILDWRKSSRFQRSLTPDFSRHQISPIEFIRTDTLSYSCGNWAYGSPIPVRKINSARASRLAQGMEQLSDWERELFSELKDVSAVDEISISQLAYDPANIGHRLYALWPLQEVFLDQKVLTKSMMHMNIETVLDKRTPTRSGVILYGPAGTGKSVLLDAFAKCYERAGCFAYRFDIARLTKKWVSSFSNELSKLFEDALQKARSTGRPCVLTFDEGSAALLESPSDSKSTRYYQEALDTIKRYVGNHNELVFAFTTNNDPEQFHYPLIRDGRLKPIAVDFPGQHSRHDMWRHFITKHNLFEPDMTFFDTLTLLSQGVDGALVEAFCRNYRDDLRISLLERQYGSYFNAVWSNARLDERSFNDAFTRERFLSDFRVKMQDVRDPEQEF